MRATPPPDLLELLGRLELATPAQVRAVHRHVRRLARDLPPFDSVWIDALVQARRLTAFQAAEIHAGRGAQLRVGPYALLEPFPSPGYGKCYRARAIVGARQVRLTVIPCDRDPAPWAEALAGVIERTSTLATLHVLPIESCGVAEGSLWAASPYVAGRTAAQWLTSGGRMPPDVVLEIARQMSAALAVCEASGVVHGDIAAQRLVLDPLGTVRLLDAGLRAVVRPTENGADHAAVTAEVYDYVAPERLRDGTPASVASDIYACGALWWHLLAGRPPLAGACGPARRRAAETTRIRAIHPIAPDAPRALVEAIRQCTEHEVARRPGNFAALLAQLGPPSDRGQALLSRHVARGATPPERLLRRVATMRRSSTAPTWAAAAGGVALALLVCLWPLATRWPTGDIPAAAATATTAPGGPQLPKVAPGAPRDDRERAREATAIARRRAETADPRSKTPQVVPASATQPLPSPDQVPATSREFVISAARPVAWSQVRPSLGQVVHSRPGERARIVIPPTGGTLHAEGVRFEDVDFVVPRWEGSASAALLVTARRVSFHRCSFQATVDADPLPVAVEFSAGESNLAVGGPSACEVEMRECVFAGVQSAVRVTTSCESTLALTEVLFLGPGSLVNLQAAGERPSATEVRLKHCTTREAACVLELWSAGVVRVVAAECVFAIKGSGAVIVLAGDEQPLAALRNVTWQGEGSLVAPKTPLVAWRRDRGDSRIVREPNMTTEGLVRTELGFAGNVDSGPDGSRLVRWQVPLRSSRPPGIGDQPLSLPAP